MRGQYPAEIDIFGDRQMWAETQLLMDGGDPPFFGCPRRQVIDDVAIERDRACIWLQHPGHKIDQCTLAGAVLADQAVDLSGTDLEVDVAQDDVAGKGFREPNGLQHWAASVIGGTGDGLFAH